MNLRKHGIAVAVALAAFTVLTLYGGAWSPDAWYTVLALVAATLVLYWHYHRRAARREQVRKAVSVVPGYRDDRVIPNSVKNIVALRDKGICQIKGPPCIIGGTVWDHKVPYSWGGSSKDPDNIQQACNPCNEWKSDDFADTPDGRITYEEWKFARA